MEIAEILLTHEAAFQVDLNLEYKVLARGHFWCRSGQAADQKRVAQGSCGKALEDKQVWIQWLITWAWAELDDSLSSGHRCLWLKGNWVRKYTCEKLKLMLQLRVNVQCEYAVLHKRIYKCEKEIQGKTVWSIWWVNSRANFPGLGGKKLQIM